MAEYYLRAVKECDIKYEMIPLSKLSDKFTEELEDTLIDYVINGIKLSSRGDFIEYEPVVYFKKVGLDDYSEEDDLMFDSEDEKFKFIVEKDGFCFDFDDDDYD